MWLTKHSIIFAFNEARSILITLCVENSHVRICQFHSSSHFGHLPCIYVSGAPHLNLIRIQVTLGMSGSRTHLTDLWLILILLSSEPWKCSLNINFTSIYQLSAAISPYYPWIITELFMNLSVVINASSSRQ